MGLKIGFSSSSYSAYDNRNFVDKLYDCLDNALNKKTVEVSDEKPKKKLYLPEPIPDTGERPEPIINLPSIILPNPDPRNYEIVASQKIGEFLIVQVFYPDCTNYEGRKTLMFEGVTIDELVNQGSIDPHFAENKDFHSPVARFEPTPKGWEMAQKLAEHYAE